MDSDFDLVWDTGVVLVLVRFDKKEERRWFFGTILPLRVCLGLRDGEIDTGLMSCLGLSLSRGVCSAPLCRAQVACPWTGRIKILRGPKYIGTGRHNEH